MQTTVGAKEGFMGKRGDNKKHSQGEGGKSHKQGEVR